MASVKIDSELMTNYLAAQPVPAGSRFVTCLDPQSRRPMVFGISNDPVPKLNVVKEDSDGKPRLLDIGAKLGISSTTPVVAFDCEQAKDLSIYLCVAVRSSATECRILVVKPFQMTTNFTMSTLPIHSVPTVSNIFMGSADVQDSYPMVLFTGKPQDQMAVGSDITRILVDPFQSSWRALRDMQLPMNVKKIVDIAPASNAYGRGLYALVTDSNDQPSIIGEFARYDTDQNDGSLYWYNVQLNCPSGASRIATFTDPYGRSSLLVGGNEGLRHFSVREATSRSAPGTVISTNGLFKRPSSLRVAQDQDQVTVWSLSQLGELGYMRSSLADFRRGSAGTVTSLLPKGRVSSYSAAVSAPKRPISGSQLGPAGPVSQTLVTNDSSGNLNVLQQSSDTGLWNAHPLYLASSATALEISSYSITMQALDNNKNVLKDGWITISVSAQTDAIVNGKNMTLTTDPTNYKLDVSGELSVIVSTVSLSAQSLTITALKASDGKAMSLSSFTYDPSAKVIDALSKITSKDALLGAKTKTGNLVDPSLSPGDQQAAVDAISQMVQASRDIRSGVQKATSSANSTANDFWHYCKAKATEAGSWFVNKINGVWNFIVTLAGETINFVMDTLERVGEGLSWVFNKLKVAWDKLKEYVGFLFAWDDILNTKDTIKTIINGFLTYGEAGVGQLENKVDSLFDSLKATIRAGKSADLSKSNDAAADPGKQSVADSTGVKWVTERLKNGGATTESTVGNVDHSNDSDLKNAADNELKTATSMVKTSFTTLSHNISQALTDLNITGAMDTLKNFTLDGLETMVSALQIAVRGILRMLAKLIGYFRELCNTPINIPVFSALFSKITNGAPFTAFEAFGLLIAIPMTVIVKMITGSAPPVLKTFSPDVIGFLFRMNANTIMPVALQSTNDQSVKAMSVQPMALQASSPSSIAPSEVKLQATSVGEVDPTRNLALLGGAMQNFILGIPLTPEQDQAVRDLWDKIKSGASAAYEDFKRELSYIVRFLPTLITGATIAIGLVIPVFTAGKILYTLATGGQQKVAEAFPAGKVGRVLSLTATILGGTMTVLYPHPQMPGVTPRMFSGVNSLVYGYFGVIFSCMGGVAIGEDYEDAFQFLTIIYKTVSFVCYCNVWDDEIKALDAPQTFPTYGNDSTCVMAGVAGTTFTLIADMCGLAAYMLIKQNSPEAKAFGLVAYGGQLAEQIDVGVLLALRFAEQYTQQFIINYARS